MKVLVRIYSGPGGERRYGIILSSDDSAESRVNKFRERGEVCFISENSVHPYISGSEFTKYRPSFEFLSATEDEKTYIWDLDSAKEHILLNKYSRLSVETDRFYSGDFDKYSQAERLSWLSQESEAVAWLGDNESPTPTIDAIYHGDDKPLFCQSVLDNALAHKQSLLAVGASQEVRADLKSMIYEQLLEADVNAMLNKKMEQKL